MDHYGTLTNVRAFDCDLVILNASDGKKYLYDIVELKENTAMANDILNKEHRKAAHTSGTPSGVSEGNISQNNEEVNTPKHKRRCHSFDLHHSFP